MNITGGMNLSLYEVQEAADIVAMASDEEVNMIFGAVINENLSDEIIVTVIATGFSDDILTGAQGAQSVRPSLNTIRQPLQNNGQQTQQAQQTYKEPVQEPVRQQTTSTQEDTLEIPTFLRNRNRNR